MNLLSSASAGMEERLWIVPLGQTLGDWFELDSAPRFFEVGSPEEFEAKVAAEDTSGDDVSPHRDPSVVAGGPQPQ